MKLLMIMIVAFYASHSTAEERMNAIEKAFSDRNLKSIQNIRPQKVENLSLEERNAVALSAAKSLSIEMYVDVIGTNSIHKYFTKPPAQDSLEEAEFRRQLGVNRGAAKLLRHLSEKRLINDPSLLPYLIEALDHPDRSFVGRDCFSSLRYLTRKLRSIRWSRVARDENKHEEVCLWWSSWWKNNKSKHPIFDSDVEQQARVEVMRLAEKIESELKPLYPSLSMFSAPKSLSLYWGFPLFYVDYNPRLYGVGPLNVDHDELPRIQIRCELRSKGLPTGAAGLEKEIPAPSEGFKNVYHKVLPRTDLLIEVLIESKDKQLIEDLRFILNGERLLSLNTKPTGDEIRKTLAEISMGDHISFVQSDAQGFVRFIDKIDGYEVIALSTDFGSAVPSADLRIYIKKEDELKKMVSLPMLKHKGYLCVKQDRVIRIFTIDSYERTEPEEGAEPVILVDLSELLKMVEPVGPFAENSE